MEEEFVCAGCLATVTRRQFVSNSLIVDSCPHCQAMIRQTDCFHSGTLENTTESNVTSVDDWLSSECEENRMISEPIRDREAEGEYLWRLTGTPLKGCPDNWILAAIYQVGTANTVQLRITVVEPMRAPDAVMASLVAVYNDHGLQPHGSRSHNISFEGEPSLSETRWGAMQCLSVPVLRQGLFRAVSRRLINATRDAKTMRDRV